MIIQPIVSGESARDHYKELFPQSVVTHVGLNAPAMSTGPVLDVTLHGTDIVRLTLISYQTSEPDHLLSTVIGANLLIKLQDQGTSPSCDFRNHHFSAEGLDQFFTDLPGTSNTVTILVAGNPGAATCDPTIATAKGYTVSV